MATEVTIPQLGESVTEGTITEWLVEVGDQVETDQPLFELSSDKIDTEVPSPGSGVVTEIRVQVDETVDVGTVVAILGSEEEAQASQDGGDGGDGQQQAEAEEQQPEADEAEQEPEAEEEPEAEQEPEAEEAEPAETEAETGTYERSEAEAPSPAGGDGEAEGGDGQTEGVLASPLVRRMIAENDLDPEQIQASGEGGRITREDVEQALSGEGGGQAQAAERQQPTQAREPSGKPETPDTPEGRQAQPQQRPQPERPVRLEAGDRERVEDLSRIRQRIAARMMESMQSSAQLTTVQEADVTAIMRLRGRHKDTFREREGVSLSPFVFLCRAAVLVLRQPGFETVSAQADWESGQVKYHDYVNLGIAVDTERGLLVPNVKNADDLTLPALARGITEAATKARSRGQLEMRDIEGGTFTVTNTGSRGVLIDTPILNYPEPAILGTGAIQKRPVVVTDDDGGESIGIRQMIYLCLTYDHRLLDGADAARFVTEVKHVVETHDWEQELGYDG